MAWEQIASMAAPLIGVGMNAISHKQQLRHQGDFMDLQIKGQKEMADYNQALGLKTWESTSYPAQMEQMKKAGLNPGLMYGSAGSGGTTGTQGGNVSSGTARNAGENLGMGLQLTSQLALMKAQKENIEADTANKKAETGVKGVQVPQIQAQTTNTQTDTELKKSQIAINEFNKQIARIESEIKTEGKSLSLGTLGAEWNKLIAETNLTEEQTKLAKANVLKVAIEGALMKSNIAKNTSDISVNKAKIEEILTGIEQKWRGLELQGIAIGSSEIHGTLQTLKDQGLGENEAQQLLNIVLTIAAMKAKNPK